MSDEQPADMLARLGSHGFLWAQEFNKTAVRLGYSEMDEGWLIGWFANAIENSCNPLRNECDELRAALELIADTDPDEGTAWFHNVANAALNKGWTDE